MKKEEICQALTNNLKSLIELRKQNEKYAIGTMNLFDINNISHYELYHSNILAYLINPNESHKHREYGAKLLKIINDNLSEDKILDIVREKVVRTKQTDENRYIDIFIETNNAIIIIENKIWAKDQKNQLRDYYQFAKTICKNKKIYLCYLTLFGTRPTEYSIDNNNLKELLEQNQLSQLSYNTDIIKWLNSLYTQQNEIELKSALIQYTDLIKGLCQIRKGEYMNLNNTVEKMEKLYDKCSDNDYYEIYMQSLDMFLSSKIYLFIKTILKIKEYLVKLIEEKNLTNKIYLTKNHERFPIEKEQDWKNVIANEGYSYMGIEIALDKNYGIAIEFQTINNDNLLFGISNRDKDAVKEYRLTKGWEEEGYNLKQDSFWWKEYTYINFFFSSLNNKDINKNENEVSLIADWIINEVIENNKLYAPQNLVLTNYGG